jgi:hypothetical protein
MNDDINVRRICLAKKVSLSNLQTDQVQPLPMDGCKDLLALKVGDRLILLKPWQKIFLEYPVSVAAVNEKTDKLIVVVSYCFGFHDALKMITSEGEVGRENWPWYMRIKWIRIRPRDERGFLWRNTGDRYLPWLPSSDDCKADDWGVRVGYKSARH